MGPGLTGAPGSVSPKRQPKPTQVGPRETCLMTRKNERFPKNSGGNDAEVLRVGLSGLDGSSAKAGSITHSRRFRGSLSRLGCLAVVPDNVEVPGELVVEPDRESNSRRHQCFECIGLAVRLARRGRGRVPTAVSGIGPSVI